MAARQMYGVALLLCCIQVCWSVALVLTPCTKSCTNGGYCTVVNSKQYCACPEAYIGDTCEMMCNTTQCSGGMCVLYNSQSKCLCPGGYIEDMCYTTCNDMVCQNNGTCSEGAGGALTCDCITGYSGSRCEVKNSNVIQCQKTSCTDFVTQNCTRDSGGIIMCHCRTSYIGQYCEKLDCLTQNCTFGSCIFENITNLGSQTCGCMAGYTGQTCDTNINQCDYVTCLNGGTCMDGIASFVCQCDTLYTGDYCEKANCTARQCSIKVGNGMCDTDCMMEECGYDALECSLGINPWENCNVMSGKMHCSAVYENGECDTACNNMECLYDGFDCVNNGTALADCDNTRDCVAVHDNGVCNDTCDNVKCGYDGQDCNNGTAASGALVSTFTPTNSTINRLVMARLVAYGFSRTIRARVYVSQNNGSDNMAFHVSSANDSDIRAYYQIEKPSSCNDTNPCATDVVTAARMVGAHRWSMYKKGEALSDIMPTLKHVTSCMSGHRYSNDSCDVMCNEGCSDVCNMETGNCLSCKSRYVGVMCEVKCSSHCRVTCNTTQCIGGCMAGYSGDNCDQMCPSGTFGADCAMTCSACKNDACSNTDGQCQQGCQMPGLMGTHCIDSCSSGQYGLNCAMACPTNCPGKVCAADTGYCVNSCPTNKWGNMCDQVCGQSTCTTKCEQCKIATTTTVAPTSSPTSNNDAGVIAGIIILLILIVIALVIAYCLWRRSQAGVYDIDEKKADELPLNEVHVENGQPDNSGTPMVAMAYGNGIQDVEVVSEKPGNTEDAEAKSVIVKEEEKLTETERKEPEGRENSTEPEAQEERDSRELKTASQYIPPNVKEGGPGGVYVGPKGPVLEDAINGISEEENVSEDASFPVAPSELVAPAPAIEDTDPLPPPAIEDTAPLPPPPPSPLSTSDTSMPAPASPIP